MRVIAVAVAAAALSYQFLQQKNENAQRKGIFAFDSFEIRWIRRGKFGNQKAQPCQAPKPTLDCRADRIN